jgi:glycosyltransferase involved in cell wall biosynthesis
MRICLVSKQFNPSGGGSERYAYEIATALARHGNDVEVFALGDDDSFFEPSLPDNLSVTYVANRHRQLVTFETLYYSLLTRRAVDFEKFDIIHGTLMPASPIALSIRPPSTPLVVTSHGTSLGEVRSHKLEVPTDYLKKLVFHPMNVLMDVMTIPRASRVIAISSDSQRELKKYYPVDSDALAHIPHGVDVDRFRPDREPHSAVNPDRLSLLHVGRLVSRKHVDLAIEALDRLGRTDVELLIAGTGTHQTRLETRVDGLGISDQVSFLGFVPEEELPSLYASSDAFLFLSRYEGFGLTFLEAMAAGTPVIGTGVGGFPDMVTDEQEGFLVERDALAVAEAIQAFLDTPSRAAEMGRCARKLAETRTWDTVATDTEAVYESVKK